MRKVTIYLLLCMGVFLPNHVQGQDVADNVVKYRANLVRITLESPDKTEIRTGSGVVVGYGYRSTYILTARHVVEEYFTLSSLDALTDEPEPLPSVYIHLYGQAEPLEARVVTDAYEKDVDLAVLKIAPIDIGFERIPVEKLSYVKSDEAVSALGFPFGTEFTPNKVNRVSRLNVANYKMSFGGYGIMNGYSGGLLAIGNKNRAIGIIIEKEGAEIATAIRINEVINFLEREEISIQYLKKPRTRLNPLTYLFAASTLVGIVGGIEFNDQGNQEFALFQSSSVPGVFTDRASELFPETEGRSRAQIYRDGEAAYRNRDISYLIGGISPFLALTVNLDWKKAFK